MRDMAAGPRVLLKRLRELMAEALEPQERLDRIVHDIAAEHGRRGLLALRACAPIRCSNSTPPKVSIPGAVHLAQLRLGQGLVGTIAASARALNLADAQQHPAFAYLPETGEEIYNSFLGVPVLRAGRTLGVLVVQNRTHAPLSRRRGRGAGDDGDGDRRDDRGGRSRAAHPAGPRTRSAPPGQLHRPVLQRRRRPRPCRAA